MALSQRNDIKSEKGMSTAAILKYKIFSDFKYHFSWRSKDKGKGGLIFRFKDS
jgi:hypothetical protein